MSIDEQPMNVYWSGKRTETSNNFKTNYKGSVATKDNLPSLGNKTGDMYNVTESGENFVWNGNSWDNLSGDISKILNWQKSEKASSVAIYPVPETALEPTVDFMFTEISPANGDKGIENPSIIAGISTITVTRCETVGVDSTDYVIDLNGTFYGGTVDLATGLLTVTWVEKKLTGEDEGLRSYGSIGTDLRYTFTITSNGLPMPRGGQSDAVCSHSNLFVNGHSGGIGSFYVRKIDNVGYFTLHDKYGAKWDSDDSFINWVKSQYNAGTPVSFAYRIETPYTVQLTPLQILSLVQTDKYTPRLNTIYTDASSVQVGYAKSSVRSEYELVQAIAVIEGSE